jgi:hypothetical protein
LAIAGVRPTQAAAQDAPADEGEAESIPVRASLNVDASAVGEAGSVLESRIRAQVDQLRLKEEVLPGDEKDDPIVTVVERSLSGDAIGYEVEVSVQHHGEVIADTFRAEQCKLCTEGEVVDQAEGMVGALVPTLRNLANGVESSAEPVPPVEKEPSAAEEIQKTPDSAESRSEDKKRRPLQAMGKAGVALIVLGGAGLGTGVGLALAPDRPKGGDEAYYLQSTRAAGYGVVAGAGAVLITGIVLLGVDRRKARKATAWLVPQVTPQGGGLVWAGRF